MKKIKRKLKIFSKIPKLQSYFKKYSLILSGILYFILYFGVTVFFILLFILVCSVFTLYFGINIKIQSEFCIFWGINRELCIMLYETLLYCIVEHYTGIGSTTRVMK